MLEDFIATIVKYLVERPEEVEVHLLPPEKSGNCDHYLIKVADDDLGRVVGKRGRIINAVRTLLVSVSARQGRKVNLSVESHDAESSDT